MTTTNSAPPALASPRRDLRSFIRRHDRLLTFSGALIVFVTFVIREGAQDHLKDRADVRQSALSTYLSNELTINSSGVLGKLAEVKEEVLATQERMQDNHLNDDQQTIEVMKLVQKYQPLGEPFIENLKDSLVVVQALAQTLDNQDRLKIKIDGAWATLSAIEKDVASMPRIPRDFEKKANEAVVRKVAEEGQRLMGQATNYWTAYGSLDKDILEQAEKEKTSAEKWYKWCKVASYGLYSIGWGLGLVGKLYGAEEMSGIE